MGSQVSVARTLTTFGRLVLPNYPNDDVMRPFKALSKFGTYGLGFDGEMVFQLSSSEIGIVFSRGLKARIPIVRL